MKNSSLLGAASMVLLLVLAGCSGAAANSEEVVVPPGAAKAIFAGGCFWCMEPPFDELDGVYATISGYIGGHDPDPTYKEVSAGRSGHTEAVEVTYDPSVVSYDELLEVFWVNIDPTTDERQFCDWGSQYRPGVFFRTPEERQAAEASKAKIAKQKTFDGPLKGEITMATTFFPAEDYHQNYYKKSPIRYKTYRRGCGRDARLRELWGDRAPH